jgi:MerR family transcriptional regulator, light-induced transcriptional regulator
MPDLPPPELPPVSPAAGEVEDLASPELVASLLADGDRDLAAWVVGRALDVESRAVVYDSVVRGAMELVGSRWETGQWTISQEHLATVTLAGVMSALRPAEDVESRVGPVAVLATPPGELHAAALTCVAQVLEEAGWVAENLGPNVPSDDLVRFLSSRRVDLLGLSVALPEHVPALQATVDAIRSAGGSLATLPILVGGRGVEGIDTGISGADHVATSLVDTLRYASSLGRDGADDAPRVEPAEI